MTESSLKPNITQSRDERLIDLCREIFVMLFLVCALAIVIVAVCWMFMKIGWYLLCGLFGLLLGMLLTS